ncbi:hypothetical protein BGZ63DRAFT_112513 [Mariannaea sp. PMI_226]|nr:hypothetical protein BGZ63DRAFT_112513 [Mariannaea sp. PMI_226]
MSDHLGFAQDTVISHLYKLLRNVTNADHPHRSGDQKDDSSNRRKRPLPWNITRECAISIRWPAVHGDTRVKPPARKASHAVSNAMKIMRPFVSLSRCTIESTWRRRLLSSRATRTHVLLTQTTGKGKQLVRKVICHPEGQGHACIPFSTGLL